jgi:hypothetical protein
MATSIFLAKLIGPFLLAIGLALLLNSQLHRSMLNEFLGSHALIVLSGVIMMPAGLAVVLTHNVWAADWRLIITLLGWIATVGGALRIIAPQRAAAIGRTVKARVMTGPLAMNISAAIYLALGALLCFFGYVR